MTDLIEARSTPWGLTFGEPNEALRSRLLEYQKTAPPLCAAALWMWHDFFEESHAIAQDDPSAEGSYWHAIIHRREPDAFNAKYWFRRVGKHPVLTQLGLNAERFVDECTAGHAGCIERQTAEWRALFAYCSRG